MPEPTAIPLVSKVCVAAPASFAAELRSFVMGTLIAAAVVALGSVLVTVLLMAGVVAAPAVVAVVAYAVLRRRRAERVGSWTALRPMAG